jgi:hypothetical protein
MAIRKKKKTLRKKTGRRKTGIPAKKNPLFLLWRKYLPFIVMAVAAALILLFLWAQSRVTEPKKLKIGNQGQVEAATPPALETVEDPPADQGEAGVESAESASNSDSDTQ